MSEKELTGKLMSVTHNQDGTTLYQFLIDGKWLTITATK